MSSQEFSSVIDCVDWKAMPKKNKEKIKTQVSFKLSELKRGRKKLEALHFERIEDIQRDFDHFLMAAPKAFLEGCPLADPTIPQMEILIKQLDTGDDEPPMYLDVEVLSKIPTEQVIVPGTPIRRVNKRPLISDNSAQKNVGKNLTGSVICKRRKGPAENITAIVTVSKTKPTVPAATTTFDPPTGDNSIIKKIVEQHGREPKENEKLYLCNVFVSKDGTPLKVRQPNDQIAK